MMSRPIPLQRGTALVVSLIMLTLITILVITALNLGAGNFRAVTNAQFRDEAIAAANLAIQSRISSTFLALPVTTVYPVDIDDDDPDNPDYLVQVTPTCISASVAETADPSSAALPPAMSLASTWNTVWDIAAVVTDDKTGASVVVHAGTRVLLGQTDKDIACPD